jgi:radial spoke head protein 9
LPGARPEFEEFAKNYTGYFTGECEKILKAVPKKGSAQPFDPEDENIDLTLDAKDFTELDRLAYVVRKIERDTHVIPQGAFKLTPIQEIRKNEMFKGIMKEDLDKLGMYQHFRIVETIEKKDQLERNEGVLQTDIFDSLASDKPKSAWTIQFRTACMVTVKSLLWPGYTFFHLGLTPGFWGVYIGDGVMNKDLPFML